MITKARMLAKSESATHRRIYLKRDIPPLEGGCGEEPQRQTAQRRGRREPRSAPRCPQQRLATSGENYVNNTFVHNVNSTLACMYFNADSLVSKMDELKRLFD